MLLRVTCDVNTVRGSFRLFYTLRLLELGRNTLRLASFGTPDAQRTIH